MKHTVVALLVASAIGFGCSSVPKRTIASTAQCSIDVETSKTVLIQSFGSVLKPWMVDYAEDLNVVINQCERSLMTRTQQNPGGKYACTEPEFTKGRKGNKARDQSSGYDYVKVLLIETIDRPMSDIRRDTCLKLHDCLSTSEYAPEDREFARYTNLFQNVYSCQNQ